MLVLVLHECRQRETRIFSNGGMFYLVCFALLLQLSIKGAAGLTGVNIRVPEAVPSGETARLACDYDLEQAALYSIKWYRGEHEFYSFVPKEDPPTRVFPMQGVKVDLMHSNEHQVTLQNVGRELTGYYKCEVSADAPLFHTEIKSALMIVVDLPTEDPTVDVEKLKYSLGEKIRANCTSQPSYPHANLTWYINGHVLHRGLNGARMESVVTTEPGGLEVAHSNLEVEASASLFVEGRLRLRCLATIFTLFRRSEELQLSEDSPQLAPVMGPTAPHSIGDAVTSAQGTVVVPHLFCPILFAVVASR